MCAVTEYVEIFNLDSFYRYQDKMREILSDISTRFLIGDVGITSKNYINWGIRHNGKDEICIMDYAYIYDVKFGIFKCSCDNETLLQYDKDFVNFYCPRCGRKYTFGEIRRKVTRKAQDAEIGDISKLGYNLHSETEVLPIDPEFTITEKKKKEKELTPAQMVIKKHKEYIADMQKSMEIFDYPNLDDQSNDENYY